MPLSEWLSFLVGSEKDKISSDGIKHVIALPMEKQQGNSETHFTHHIQQLSLHLLETRYDRDTAKQILQQKPEVVEDEKAEKNVITSKQLSYLNLIISSLSKHTIMGSCQ